MKSVLTFSLLFLLTGGAFAAAPKQTTACKAEIKALTKDTAAIASLLADVHGTFQTKSNKPSTMLLEFLNDHYQDAGNEFDEKDFKKIGEEIGEAEAGFVNAKQAADTIFADAETWYLDGDKKKEAKLKAAVAKLKKHKITYALDGHDQGWGGSPATNVLLMLPQCKHISHLFLGITHD